MNSIKDITNQDLPDSSIRAQEIKDIYQKWWKYIDEWFWSLRIFGNIEALLGWWLLYTLHALWKNKQ